MTRTVGLDLADGIAALSGSSARVKVQLRATTGTRALSVGIVLSGARPDRTYTLSTDRVLVTIGGANADLDALVGRTLAASAEVGDLEPGVHDVALRVVLPSPLALVAISSPRISVTVGSPPTPLPTSTAPSGPTPSGLSGVP